MIRTRKTTTELLLEELPRPQVHLGEREAEQVKGGNAIWGGPWMRRSVGDVNGDGRIDITDATLNL